jgi:MFS family permease
MIPYAFATFSLPIAAIIADRIDKRAIPLLVCLCTSVTGFVIVIATTNKAALVAGCCFVAAGCYPAIVIASVWLMNNNAGYTKRSTAWATTQVFIQCYSIISTQIYDNPPRYFKGHGVLLAFNVLGVVAAVINYFLMKRENAKRNHIAEEYAARGEEHPDLDKTFEEVCDYHPSFRYKL